MKKQSDNMRSPLAMRTALFSGASALLLAVIAGACEVGRGDDPVAQCAVTVLSVSPSGQTLLVGATQQYSASVNAANCSTVPPVSWSSNSPNVATVSGTGLVTAIAAGTAAIVARVDISTAQAQLTVTQPPVATIDIAPAALTLEHSAVKGQLAAVVKDQQGNTLNGRAIAWQSLTPSVATVSASGQSAQVTTVSIGEAIIQATSEGRTALSRVTVTQSKVAAVTVTLPSGTLFVGQTTTAVAQLRDFSGTPISRSVAWSSSNPAAASVNSANGSVTALSPGTTVITANSEGVTGQATLTVTLVPVFSVSVTVPSALTVGVPGQATAIARDAQGGALSGRIVAWTSSNVAVALVNSTSGVVIGVGAGSVNIIATVEGVSGQGQVTVAPVSVATVGVTLVASSLVPGQTTQATATTRDASGNTLQGRVIVWASSTPSVATVNSSGVVTAVAQGAAQITATSEGKVGAANLTVAPVPVASVSVAIGTPSILVGQTTPATATVKDAQGNVLAGRIVAWQSLAPAVAVVNATTGLVTAIAPGTAQINAIVEGVSGGATVTVTQVPVATVSVTLSDFNLNVGQTATATVVAKDANGNVLNGRVANWSFSGPGFGLVLPASNAWTPCATEGGTCQFSGQTRLVRFGANGIYAYKIGLDATPCASSDFGRDPVYGFYKRCDFALLPTTTTGGAAAIVSTMVPGIAFIVADVEGKKSAAVPLYAVNNFPMGWAYVWSDGGTVSTRNLAGGTVTARKTTNVINFGRYAVEFTGMGIGTLGTSFTAHVAADVGIPAVQLANPPGFCQQNGSPVVESNKVTVFVNCYAAGESQKDLPFRVVLIGDNVLAGWSAPDQRAAFGFGYSTSALTGSRAWNSWGEVMWGRGSGTQVQFLPGPSFDTPFTEFLNYVSNDVTVECGVDYADNNDMGVTCRDRFTPQALANVSVNMLMFEKGRPGHQYGYAMVSGTFVDPNRSSNPQGSTTIFKWSTGRYTVTFNGTNVSTDPAILLQPAFNGAAWRRCTHSIQSRNPVKIDVSCWSNSTTFADANFNVAFIN